MEDPSRSQATGVSPGADLREIKGRGAPKVTKNNYFGERGSINSNSLVKLNENEPIN